MRRLACFSLLCAALAVTGCIGDDAAAPGVAGAGPTSITGTSATAANAWTTPPPPGYAVRQPVVAQPTPVTTWQPAPPALPPTPSVAPAPLPPPLPSAAPTAPDLPSWTPPAPAPIEEAPPAAGGGSGCGGGGKG